MQAVQKQIFVVDDDVFHLEIMKQLLTDAGQTNITTFTSGVDCLNEIHQNPEVIFLDHQMDVYNGFQTLQKIKRHNPNIFVIMVSAQEDIDTAVATLKFGAFDYIRKDNQLQHNIMSVMHRVGQVKEMLRASKPSFVKSVFKFI